jgi:ATP-dependent Lhr-like helicase
LNRADFDACLSFLAGDLASPPGAFEPEPGATPRWTSARIWRHRGRFGLRTARVLRWFRQNVGTITSEESVRVLADGIEIGTLEGAYAERLQSGDRFVLDGRALEFRRLEGLIVHAKASGGEPELPRWSSDRQSLSAELAHDLARFRDEAASHALDGPSALRGFLVDRYDLDPDAAFVIEDLFRAQERFSEIPRSSGLLIEESPHEHGYSYAFHAPLSRSACDAAGRAMAARIGRRFGQNLALVVADLGWSITLTDGARLTADEIAPLLSIDDFASDVLCGLDRGELLARRFRHVAATALMVLRNPEGGRTKVGGLLWVSNRLYPLVKAASPDHPLLRETRREVLDDLLDTRSAMSWLSQRPSARFRSLDAPSPFTTAWIDSGGTESLTFESQDQALKRLHARLTGVGTVSS